MAIVGRSAMPGIATGIGVFFLEDIVTALMRAAGGWIANVPDYLLNTNTNAITALNDLPTRFAMGGAGASATLPTLLHASSFWGFIAWFFLFLGFYLFRNRDVTV